MTMTDWAGPDAPAAAATPGVDKPATPARDVDTTALAQTIDSAHALAAEAGAMDVKPSAIKSEAPQVNQAGSIATKGLDGVTDAIVSQIDAAVSELNNLREAVISSNEATRAQVGRQVQLGTVVSQIVTGIRAGFRVPAA